MSLKRKNFCGSHPSMASYIMKSVHESNQREKEEAERREDERVKILAKALSEKENKSSTNQGITININLPDSNLENIDQSELVRIIKESMKSAIEVADSAPNDSSNKKDYEA